jgi:hypothetical protein
MARRSAEINSTFDSFAPRGPLPIAFTNRKEILRIDMLAARGAVTCAG